MAVSFDDEPAESLPLNTVLTECASTQVLARECAERGAPHGSWISARVQTNGRGRHERVWISSRGNLFLSVILREIPPALWTWIPLVAALAVRRAVLDLLPSSAWEPRISIKWPNDLLVDGAKAAGILCESSLAGDAVRSFVIVGIGVNCAEAPDLADRPTARIPVSSDALRTGVVRSLLSEIAELTAKGGVERAASSYLESSFLRIGAVCRWVDSAGDQHEGVVLGLGPHGELRVAVTAGAGLSQEKLLSSEEVSLGGRIAGAG